MAERRKTVWPTKACAALTIANPRLPILTVDCGGSTLIQLPLKFSDLALDERILRAVAEKGYEHPTPIQEGAIPKVLDGHDVIGVAQTGTGKTAAFSIPTLQILTEKQHSRRGNRTIKGLILTPTRELAIQIAENIDEYGKYLDLKYLVIFGGVGQNPQVQALRKGVDLLIATPGRLLDLMDQGFVHLNSIEFFVLDEADRMLDMGFVHDVRKVLKLLPSGRQNLLFSATMPENIVTLAKGFMTNPQTVAVTPPSTTAERVDQAVYYVDKSDKRELLAYLLKEKLDGQVLVFSRTKHGANKIVSDLDKNGIDAAAIHGNKSQTARQKALGDFKDGNLRVLVATDIAARGIDVSELPQVIQFDLPNVAETYVHRIGRTGRAGMSGQAISFCETDEKAYLRDIYKLTKQPIEVVSDHPFVLADDGEPDPQRAIPADGRDKHQHPRNPEHMGGGNRGRGRGRQGGGGASKSGGSGGGRGRSGGGGRSASTASSGGTASRGRR